MLAWETAGIGDDIEVAVLWQNEYEPGRVFNQRVEVEAGRVQPTLLAGNPKWIGRINGIALALRGKVAEPILIRGATAKTMSPREVLADRIGEWLKFEPWNGASINTLIGGSDTQDLPMSFTFAVVVALAALIYFGLARWRPQWVGGWRPFIVGAMFLGAWVAIDARWLWNFARQVGVTAELYAGKSWHERHLAPMTGRSLRSSKRCATNCLRRPHACSLSATSTTTAIAARICSIRTMCSSTPGRTRCRLPERCGRVTTWLSISVAVCSTTLPTSACAGRADRPSPPN